MTRRRAVVVVLVCCCVLLGVKTIQSAAPAVAASTAPSRTAPRALTNHFPLGPQRLCCQSQSQSASHSQTSAAPPSNGATPPARSGAGGSSGGAHHAASGVTVAAFWIILGAVAAALLAVGIARLRRRRRGSAPVLSPGVPAAGHVSSARPRPAADHVASARPRPAADPASLAPRKRGAAGSQRNSAQERRRRGHPETVEGLAYRRADMSTPARVEFNVAVKLHERGDLAEAIAAYRRAERRGDPDAAFNLGVLLCEAGDLDGAETSWQRSAHHGNTRATEDLAILVRGRRARQAAGTGAVPVPAGPVGARAGSAQTRAVPAPGVASGTHSVPRPHNKTAARASRPPVIPMDSAIAPMAADAFSRMAHDADNATDPESKPRAEDESEDPGDTE